MPRISIHAPHARSDSVVKVGSNIAVQFQSTLLMRGATDMGVLLGTPMRISIHAPHARSDFHVVIPMIQSIDFNPRSSCEERLCPFCDTGKPRKFQSTLLMRGATINETMQSIQSIFQSTLLMRGATAPRRLSCAHRAYFNPRSSCEERRCLDRAVDFFEYFNPRSSCEERRAHLTHDGHCAILISIHAPHARSDFY